MKTSDPIIVRVARLADAKAMAQCHYEAVHQLTDDVYVTATLDAWSPPVNQHRIDGFAAAISGDVEWMLVATRSESVVGFGSLTPGKMEITAVYVHPDVAGAGVGRMLLSALEQKAKELGIQRLNVSASMNARNYYERCGYRLFEKTDHLLNSGITIACAKMTKFMDRNDAQEKG